MKPSLGNLAELCFKTKNKNALNISLRDKIPWFAILKLKSVLKKNITVSTCKDILNYCIHVIFTFLFSLSYMSNNFSILK